MRYLFTLIKSPWNVNVLLQNMVIPLLSSSAHAKRRTAQEEKAMDRSTCATLGTWPIKDTSGVKVKGRALIYINRRLTVPGANSRALQATVASGKGRTKSPQDSGLPVTMKRLRPFLQNLIWDLAYSHRRYHPLLGVHPCRGLRSRFRFIDYSYAWCSV